MLNEILRFLITKFHFYVKEVIVQHVITLPGEPTDEALQGEETLDPGSKGLFGLLIKNKDAIYNLNIKKELGMLLVLN